MKKKKLSLEKFRIAKLSNADKIIGGTGANDGTVDTDTRPLICVAMSDIYVTQEEAEAMTIIKKKTGN